MIRLENVSKSFSGQPALRPLSLDLERGRTTVIIGPSGCGKSTLLRLINGLLFPDDGRVWIDGVELTAGNALELRREMGYVIQEGGLFPHLTARRNIVLMARFLALDPAGIEHRLAALTQLAKLSPALLERYPAQLSGGQRQRVGLMRALMLDPKLLLLDEPLGALDPMIRAELQDDLKTIFRSLDNTVVLVTHDLAEAAYFADSILLLRDGELIQQGAVDDLVERPASSFVTRFIRAQRFSPASSGAPDAGRPDPEGTPPR